MNSMVKGQISELSDEQSHVYKLFRQPLSGMSFSELVAVSSFLQAMSKRIDERRSSVGDILDEKIEEGDVENRILEDSDTGSSTRVIMPGFNVQRIVRSSKREASVGNLRSMLEDIGADGQIDNLLKPKKEKVNKKKLEKLLKEHGIDRSEVFEVKSYEVDEQKLKALAEISRQQDIGFEISEEDVESVYETTTGSSYVKCTFDKELKEDVLSSLDEDESSTLLEENSSDSE